MAAVEPTPLLPNRSNVLPYDLTGFVVEQERAASASASSASSPAVVPRPVAVRPHRPEPAPPQIAARAPLEYRANGVLYNRTPDHLALTYDLTGFVPPRTREPSYGPLEYELRGLLGAGSP